MLARCSARYNYSLFLAEVSLGIPISPMVSCRLQHEPDCRAAPVTPSPAATGEGHPPSGIRRSRAAERLCVFLHIRRNVVTSVACDRAQAIGWLSTRSRIFAHFLQP